MSVVHWVPRPLRRVVSVGAWRFTIHHADCADYRRAEQRNRDRPVSPGMRLVVCGHCHPPEEMVTAYLPTVGIELYSHGGFGRRQRSLPVESRDAP